MKIESKKIIRFPGSNSFQCVSPSPKAKKKRSDLLPQVQLKPIDYYYSFFNPELNPWIKSKIDINNYQARLTSYKRSMITASRQVSQRTIRERAAIIRAADDKTILGYLETFVLFNLDSVDVAVLNILNEDSSFVEAAGRAIMREQDYYKIQPSEIAQDDFFQESDEEKRIKAHLSVCAYCSYTFDAIQTASIYMDNKKFQKMVDRRKKVVEQLSEAERRRVFDDFFSFKTSDLVLISVINDMLREKYGNLTRAKESFYSDD